MSDSGMGIAILGCGARGKGHAEAWSERGDAVVRAVFDPQEQPRRELAAQHEAEACATPEEAVDRGDVDVVSVCSPASFHAAHARTAMEAGKHVLCEKPLATNVADADALVGAAERAGVWLTVFFQRRHDWAWARLVRAALADGRLEPPLLARMGKVTEWRPKLAMHKRSMNNGPVLDLGGHFTDLMRWWTGAEPRRVLAMGHVFGGAHPELADVEDLAVDAALVHVQFEEGHALEQMLHWALPKGPPRPQTEPVVMGRTAALAADQDGLGLFAGEGRHQPVDPEDRRPNAPLHDLADAVKGGAAPEITAWDGRQAVAVSEAAFASMERGGCVDVP